MNENDLSGMKANEAKDFIMGVITTLKLTEKQIHSLEDEEAKWRSRVDMARSRGMDELEREAGREVEAISTKLAGLREEALSFKNSIAEMRRQLPGLAARERSIDPDLLEQELLMVLGQTEEENETEKAFRKLEKEGEADTALEALKAKMKGDKP